MLNPEKPFTSVSFIEQMIMNPAYQGLAKVWRNYRIEYYYDDSQYSEDERSIWLPVNFDAYELEKQINKKLRELRGDNETPVD